MIRIDSRKIKPGDIFIAYKGEKTDGHAFIEQAIKAGASKIIYEDSTFDGKISIPHEKVRSARARWASLEAERRNHPERNLTFIGITGTNGKTSTVQMIRDLLKLSDVDCLTIGTLGAQIGDKHFETSHTTPDPDRLFELLEIAVTAKVKVVVMEVSSHSIHFEKFDAIRFAITGFTSFSQDHLDLHKSMEHYLATKIRLLSELSTKNSVCFAHESVSTKLPKELLVESYGLKGKHSLEILSRNDLGMEIKIDGESGQIPIFGDFLAENFCCALLASQRFLNQRIPASHWKQINVIPGRLEPAKKKNSNEPLVIVDYAHTPDGLEKAILACRKFTKGKLHVVFGCGGDRDPGKRPQMGAIAEKLSDFCYVTSDNPRSEDPEKIIRDILGGMKTKPFSNVDRRSAIREALKQATSLDTVLIAGKGHENYQLIGDRKLDFDDRLIARELLKEIRK